MLSRYKLRLDQVESVVHGRFWSITRLQMELYDLSCAFVLLFIAVLVHVVDSYMDCVAITVPLRALFASI